jgi:hypothetical protein
MKVSPRDFYKELRHALGPLMKAGGFRSIKGAALAWERPATDGYLCVWFECDKWGWNERWGCTFTLGFDTRAQPGPGGRALRDERLGYLLEGFDEYDQLRVRNNAVVARLPGTLNHQLVLGRTRDGRDYVMEGHRVETEPFVLGKDTWLNYHSIDDVRDWAAYFAANLLRFVSMYENQTRSPLGHGRVRFNRALTQVQALGADQQARKLEILGQFIRDEPTDYWKAAGAFWVDEIRKEHPGA